MKCQDCRTDADLPCLGERLGRLCTLGPEYRDQLARNARGAPARVDPRAVAIESCEFRTSDCGCLNRPARCSLHGEAAVVHCLADCPIQRA